MSMTYLLAAVDPSWLMLAGIAVLTGVMIRLVYRRQRPERPPSATVSDACRAAPPVASSSPDMLRRLEAKEVEFNDLSREALARLDNKIIILQRLLAESEAAIVRLQEARRQAFEVTTPEA